MSWTKKINDHYQKIWRIEGELCSFAGGPVHELPNDFHVLAFPPHDGRTLWTYATSGMSQPDDKEPVELHLFSPVASNSIVEILFAVAHFHRTTAKLNLWHTINFGRPWLDSSSCDYGLISLPYLDGPELENLDSPIGIVKCYWLIPITNAELNLKVSKGVEVLESRFEEVHFDYSDPLRKSVV